MQFHGGEHPGKLLAALIVLDGQDDVQRRALPLLDVTRHVLRLQRQQRCDLRAALRFFRCSSLSMRVARFSATQSACARVTGVAHSLAGISWLRTACEKMGGNPHLVMFALVLPYVLWLRRRHRLQRLPVGAGIAAIGLAVGLVFCRIVACRPADSSG